MKPCPFCSLRARANVRRLGGWAWVQCLACRARGPRVLIGPGDAENAVASWNARTIAGPESAATPEKQEGI